MGLFEQLAGMAGGGGLGDFLARYEQGRPEEGYDDNEVAERYRQVAGQVDPETYEHAARDSFDRLDPAQRAELGRALRGAAQEQGVAADDDSDEPASLARLARRSHERSPDLLGQLLGGGAGGGLGGGLGSLLSNPAAKGALAGIAAMAVKRMMQQRG